MDAPWDDDCAHRHGCHRAERRGDRGGLAHVAAGAVVLEGTVVPPGSLVAGVPAKVRRELTDVEREGIRHNAAAYLRHVEEHTTPVD